ARWNLRSQEQVHRHFALQVLKHGDWDLQVGAFDVHGSYILPSFENSQIGRDDLHAPIIPFSDNRVEVFVYCGTEHSSAELFVISRQISTTTPETNPHWTAYYEHLETSPLQLKVGLGVTTPRDGTKQTNRKAERDARPTSP